MSSGNNWWKICTDDADREAARRQMVSRQIIGRGIQDPRLLDVLQRLPRHCFVPPEERSQAYADCALAIGLGQTISQPYIVALMSELLALQGSERVLEIGTGSGYQAAVLAGLAAEVHTIERLPALAERARRTLTELGILNVTVHLGDGSGGLPAYAPYQGILAAAAAPSVPPPLLAQLAEGGRLILPVGDRVRQQLEIWTRRGGELHSQGVIPVTFVPLRGEHGWKEGWE